MASGMSLYLENKLLEHALGKTAYTMPNVYAALCTVTPTKSGISNELAGAGYSRMAITVNNAANGSISNNLNVVYPVATASWGNVKSVALMDAPTGGNLLWFGDLDIIKLISSGDQFVLPAGSTIVSFVDAV